MTDTLTKLISVTPDAEKHMAYCARVSNPANQENEKFSGLLKYCVKHQHWSIFEQAYMTLELNTTRGIAAQVLRHRSFTYQEFSQRYADSSLLSETIPLPELRRQDTKNRQNSIDDIDPFVRQEFQIKMQKHFDEGMKLYKEMLDASIAKECARFVLPLACPTKIYMTGLSALMDSLHRFAFCKRYTEGAHGHCSGCKEDFLRTVSCRCGSNGMDLINTRKGLNVYANVPRY